MTYPSNVLQLAYKQFHSTETALVKVRNDISVNTDYGRYRTDP